VSKARLLRKVGCNYLDLPECGIDLPYFGDWHIDEDEEAALSAVTWLVEQMKG
jgi:hypothetical protein